MSVEPLRVDLVGVLRRLAEEYGDFVRFPLGTRIYYLLNRPEHVRALLAENAHRLEKPAFLKDSNRGHWGDGLTTLEGPEWRARRALLRPAFRRQELARNAEVAAALAEEMASSFRAGQVVKLRTEIRTLTARVAARLLFDAEVEGFGAPATMAARAGVIRFEEAFGEDFTAVMQDEPIAPIALTRPRAPRVMSSTLALIDDRLHTREDRGDVLSFLVNATLPDGSRLGREEVAGEILQMLYAGHLTVAWTLAHLFRLLAHHPDAARRVREEPGTSYCEMALREAMRVFPPAPILFREVAIPFEIGSHPLEKGAAAWVCPALLHHDPRHFPDPERFRPERFGPGEIDRIPDYAYLPFGAGPRTCIGNRAAAAQMVAMASAVARRWSLVPVEAGVTSELFEVTEPR